MATSASFAHAVFDVSPESSTHSTTEPDAVKSRYPSLYQINTRVWLTELSEVLHQPATLDDIPDKELDRLGNLGFDWVWLLGVWQTGAAGQKVSREHPDWQREFQQTLPDLRMDDICGSCFAVTGYSVHQNLGGNAALERLRRRLHERGMRLLLDFVPNHTALDHPWVQKHPKFYVHGTEEQLQREPQNYTRIHTPWGSAVLAYGRDPYFAGWPDTLQLNYAEPALQEAMRLELLNVASLCDGVRCDMAMLILPEIFQRTWGLQPEPFWPRAIQYVRSYKQKFIFMAEVYWDLEWTLQQQGFDYTYDKRLYDRLRDYEGRSAREHFRADIVFQQKLVRFLENHDEPRAADTFKPDVHRAAAVLTYLSPGLRFFHDGQFEGRTKKLSVHLSRRPVEAPDTHLCEFYDQLLSCINRFEVRHGQWELLHCIPAWEGNWTYDCFICFAWQSPGASPLIVVVNYAPNHSQCYLRIPTDDMRGHTMVLRDMLSQATYERNGDELLSHGLYLDLPPWGYHVFKTSILGAADN